MGAKMKDVPVSISLEMCIGDVHLSITRGLEPVLWRQRPLATFEYELREMIMQMLAPSVTAYDQAVQALASGALPPPEIKRQ